MARFHLNFVGDVMLGRLIDQLLPTHVHCPEEALHIATFAAGNPELRNYCVKSPWGNTLPLFRASDLNLINLETSVTTHSRPWPDKVFNYRMHPTNVESLKEARIDYASLANNHTLDFSEAGLVETVRTLKTAGICFAGAGETRDEAIRPAVLHLGGRNGEDTRYTIHVYSASDHPSDWSKVSQFHLIDYSASTRSRLKSLLTTSERPDLKIFSVHWGPNYSWNPDEDIRHLAHFLIDECEVDIIHGHSSHHIQGVEVYKGRLVIYGCGDFVDDYAVNGKYRNDISAIWRVIIEEQEEVKGLCVKRLEVLPSRIKLFQANLLERNDPDYSWVQEKFTELNRALKARDDSSANDDQIVVQVNP